MMEYQYTWGVEWLRAVTNSFCNFMKLTSWHSYPPYTMIGQLCRYKKVSRVCGCLWRSLFLILYTNICVTVDVNNLSEGLSENVNHYPQIITSPSSIWALAFHSIFKCGHLEQLYTLLTSNMLRPHIAQTSSFRAQLNPYTSQPSNWLNNSWKKEKNWGRKNCWASQNSNNGAATFC